MALERLYFPLTNALGVEVGDRVRFTSHVHGSGEGTIALIWLGIEECVNVECDDGRRSMVVPALGDQIERVTEGEEG